MEGLMQLKWTKLSYQHHIQTDK